MNRITANIIAVLLFSTLCSIGSADELLVPSQYPTIQSAINAAGSNDTIVIAQGTYTGSGNRDINFHGKSITVRSTNPNDPNVVAATVIDCQGTETNRHRGFKFVSGESPNSILAGLTITNGYAPLEVGYPSGGAIYCEGSSPTINHCVITGNTSDGPEFGYGGGIDCYDNSNAIISHCTISNNKTGVDYGEGGGIDCYESSPTITDCIITGNKSFDGGGIEHYRGNPIIKYCIIAGNSAYAGGGANFFGYIYGSNPIITNCVIAGNTAEHGGGLCCSGKTNATISHCTITDNLSNGCGGGVSCYEGIATVSNCIIWGNTAHYGQQLHLKFNGSNLTISYSDVQEGQSGVYVEPGCTLNWDVGNIDSDPYFVNPSAGDYHLLVSSPCINAGDPCYSGGPSETDIDGDQRVIDNRTDIGADEVPAATTPIITTLPSKIEFSVDYDRPNPETQILSIRNGGIGTLSWNITEDCPWLKVTPTSGESSGDTNEVALSVDTLGLVVGSYNCELTITADGAANSPQTVKVILYFYIPGNLHVPTKYQTIQAAISAAEDGDTVIVADGIYTGPGNRDIELNGKATTVRSEHGPENCIIDCQGSASEPHRGFCLYNTGEDSNSVIDGFTITGGYVSDDVFAIFPEFYGGAIFCYGSYPMIKNCIIRGNSTEYDGGGIYIMWEEMQPRSYIRNCIIEDNYAGYDGGGIWTDAYVTISNSIVSNNVSGEYGGGISIPYIAQEINNCTIVSNSAADSGGGLFAGGGFYEDELNVANSIFWDNNAPQGSEISLRNYNTPPDSPPTEITLSYSDIEGGTDNIFVETGCVLNWDIHNINSDPCFFDPNVGDYHLLDNSPCINTGDPDFVPIPGEKDIDGEPRIVGGRVDIGADEFVYIGDLNFDGSVDTTDLNTFVLQSLDRCNDIAGDQTDWCSGADIDRDTIVDLYDFAELALSWKDRIE